MYVCNEDRFLWLSISGSVSDLTNTTCEDCMILHVVGKFLNSGLMESTVRIFMCYYYLVLEYIINLNFTNSEFPVSFSVNYSFIED